MAKSIKLQEGTFMNVFWINYQIGKLLLRYFHTDDIDFTTVSCTSFNKCNAKPIDVLFIITIII